MVLRYRIRAVHSSPLVRAARSQACLASLIHYFSSRACKGSIIISTLTGKEPNFRKTESDPSLMGSEWWGSDLKLTFFYFCQTLPARVLCLACSPSPQGAEWICRTTAAKVACDWGSGEAKKCSLKSPSQHRLFRAFLHTLQLLVSTEENL